MYLTIERDGKTFHTTVTPVSNERSAWATPAGTSAGQIQLGAVEPGYPGREGRPEEGRPAGLPSTASRSIRIYKFQEITKNSGGKPIEIEFQRERRSTTGDRAAGLRQVDGPARWMIGVIRSTS